jgi:high affinity Mn2+ porin
MEELKAARCLFLLLSASRAAAQDPPQFEKWNLFYQATSIGQYHPAFHSPYQGPLSLLPHAEAEASLTSTLFLGLRLPAQTQFYVNPEVAGGRGFSNTDGIANFPNGEMPRVAAATPKPYLARLYITHDFAVGEATETVESTANQLGGTRPETHYSVTAGRFTVTDFFDLNRYTHDPRTQFMGWAIMYNGAWDYPADTRGYTWGWMHEFHTRNWSVRYASVAMPRQANGLRFDRRILINRGDVAEGELHVRPGGHEGVIRALSYRNHANAGRYAAALLMAHPDVTATRRNGTVKYGFGLNVEQEVAKGVGLFGRLGWNDGKTESFAFTAVDRLATAGVSVSGERWRRANDVAGSAITICGISGVHALYLARGGLDFLIGDGTLRYGPETAWESYYSARVLSWLFASLDAQHIANPAYNRDRGPVWVGAFRLHIQR